MPNNYQIKEKDNMLRDDLIRIVRIFQNDGIDETTNKMITNDQMCDFMEFFDDNVNHEAGTELIFDSERYGLAKDATAEEIVDFALKGNN